MDFPFHYCSVTLRRPHQMVPWLPSLALSSRASCTSCDRYRLDSKSYCPYNAFSCGTDIIQPLADTLIQFLSSPPAGCPRHWLPKPCALGWDLLHLLLLGSEVFLGQDSHHAQEPPRSIRWLRANTDPVLGARRVELEVLVQLAGRIVRVGFRCRVVCTDNFEGLGVARRPAERPC